MKRNTAVVVLLSVVVGSGVMLNGYGKRSAVSSASGNDVKPAETSIAQSGGSVPEGQLLSNRERLLVQLFRGLLLMDKKPELAIQKAQAEQMLPLIRKSGGSGEITAADKWKITDFLSVEQRAFLVEAADKLKQGGESGNGKGAARLKDMSDEERKKMLSDMRKKRESENRNKPNDNRQINRVFPAMDTNADDDWSSGEKSVEQQLMELLDARAKSF